MAVVHDNRERLERVLAGHDLVFVDTGDAARQVLEKERFGLVLLGVHFDESQMFSLLGDIRAHAKYRKVPILCVLGTWGRMLSEVAVEGLDHAVKALIDGDLQHIARATGAPVRPLHLERRSTTPSS